MDAAIIFNVKHPHPVWWRWEGCCKSWWLTYIIVPWLKLLSTAFNSCPSSQGRQSMKSAGQVMLACHPPCGHACSRGCVPRAGGGQKPRSVPWPVFFYYSHPLRLFLLRSKSWKHYLSGTFVGKREELHGEHGDEPPSASAFLSALLWKVFYTKCTFNLYLFPFRNCGMNLRHFHL